jgi:hypothetical protein
VRRQLHEEQARLVERATLLEPKGHRRPHEAGWVARCLAAAVRPWC